MKSEAKENLPETKSLAEWSALPMELAKHFKDCDEWTLMQVIWFKSNLNGYILNLSDLSNSLPKEIGYRDTLIKLLGRLADKGWIKKTPYQHGTRTCHKYLLNRDGFCQWADVVAKTSPCSKPDINDVVAKTSDVVITTSGCSKQDITDKKDNLLDKCRDNGIDKGYPVTKTVTVVDRAVNLYTEQVQIENTQSPSLAKAHGNFKKAIQDFDKVFGCITKN